MSTFLRLPAMLSKLRKIPAVPLPVLSRKLRTLAQNKLYLQNEINVTKFSGILYPGSVSFRCYSGDRSNAGMEPHGLLNQYLGYLEKLNFYPQQVSVITKLFSLLNEADHVSPHDARLVLKICGAHLSLRSDEKIKNLHKAWDILEKKGVQFDISHFNTILKTYVENEHTFQPPEFLEKIANSKLEPNKIIYEYLIYAYCQMGDLSGAMKILEHVKQQDMSVSNLVFEGLILGHAKTGDMEKASDVIALMKASQLKPTANTYKTLAVVQAETGNMEAVRETMALAEENYQRFTSNHLMDMVLAFAKNGFSEHAETILSESDKHRPFYHRNLNQLIYQLMNAGCYDLAGKVFNYFPEKSKGNNWYLNHMIKCGLPLEDVMKTAEVLQLKTNDEFLQGLLRGENYLERSMEVFNFVEGKGHEIRLQYFFPLISASVSSDYEGLNNIMTEMGRHKFDIDPSSMDFLVNTLLKSKMTDMAICTLLQEVGCGFIQCVNRITQRLFRENHFERAYNFIGNTGTMLTKNTCLSLVFALSRNNEYFPICKALNHFRDDSSAVDLFVRESMKRTENANNSRGIQAELLINNLLKAGVVLPEETTHWLKDNAEYFKISYLTNKIDQLSRNDRPIRKLEANMQEEDYTSMVGKLVENMKREGSANGRLLGTFQYFTKEGKLEEAESLFNELREAKCVTSGHFVSMVAMYAEHNQTDKAMNMFNSLHEFAGSDIVIDRKKIVLLARALINSDKITEAYELLEKEGSKYNGPEEMYSDFYKRNVRELMKSLSVKTQDPETLDKFVHLMLENNYYPKESGILFHPVATFLASDRTGESWEYETENANDTVLAFERVQKYFDLYQMLPLRDVLMRNLLKQNDQKRVEELCGMISKVFNEEESLFVMLNALLNQNRPEDAIQLLKDNEKWIRSHLIASKFNQYLKAGRVVDAEKLLSITLHIASINRIELFESMLRYYESKNDCQSGLELWNRMQEEGVSDSLEFRNRLARLLVKNGKQSPFPYSESEINMNTNKAEEKADTVYGRLSELISNEKFEEYSQAFNKLSAEELSSVSIQLILNLNDKGQPDLAFHALKRIALKGETRRVLNSSPAQNLFFQTKQQGFFKQVKEIYLLAPQDSFLHRWLCLHASTEMEKDEALRMSLENENYSLGLYALLHDSPQRLAQVEKVVENVELENQQKIKRALWVTNVIKGDLEAAEQMRSEIDYAPWKEAISGMIHLNFDNLLEKVWNIPDEEERVPRINFYFSKMVAQRNFESAKECISHCEKNGIKDKLDAKTMDRLERRMEGESRRLARESSTV